MKKQRALGQRPARRLRPRCASARRTASARRRAGRSSQLVPARLQRANLGSSAGVMPMKTCSNTGSDARARAPSAASSVGHRAPAEQLQPFLVADPREQRLHLARARSRPAAGRSVRRRSRLRGAARTRAPARGRTRPASAAGCPRRRPVLASQPQAPRCSRLISSFSPCSTMACERRPFRWTTKPTPQASFSKRGS